MLPMQKQAGDGEMAQRVKTLADVSQDLSSIPGTHMVEGERKLLQVVI